MTPSQQTGRTATAARGAVHLRERFPDDEKALRRGNRGSPLCAPFEIGTSLAAWPANFRIVRQCKMNRDQFVQKRARYETRQDGEDSAAESQPLPPQILSLETSGFSLLIDGRPVFLPFRDHPAFADVPADKLRQVRRTGSNDLYWPELDVKLSVTALQAGAAAN